MPCRRVRKHPCFVWFLGMVQEMLQAQVFEDLQVVAVKKNVSHVSLERPAAKRDSYFS